MHYLAVKCACRKIRALNKLIGPELTFKFDKQTDIMYVLYESVSYSGVKAECIYLERVPRKLFNILTKRNINEASAVYNGTIRLKCNGVTFILNKIAPVAASEDIYYVPPNCIY